MDRRRIVRKKNHKLDYHFLSLVTGKTLTITVTHGVYQGTLINVEYGQALMLCKVKDLATNAWKPGVHLFFDTEILDVTLHEDQKTIGDFPTKPQRECGSSSQMKGTENIETREEKKHIVSIKAIESAVENLDVQFTVINQFGEELAAAINHIRYQNVISLVPAGSNLSRHGNLFWFQVASKSHVYLFDIEVLGSSFFKYVLKKVLENINIVKVVYDCRGLSDYLYHQYGILIANVFDIQVADIYIFHINTGGFLPQRTSTLEECLTKHLNMHPSRMSFLSQIQDIMKDKQLVWTLRPMPVALHKALALEASYFLSLHMAMENAVMADLTALVNGYIKVYEQNNEALQSWNQVAGSKLPQDFQKLSILEAKRKEQARKDYAMDENGLLIIPKHKQSNLEENQKAHLNPMHPDHNEEQNLPTSDIKRAQSFSSSPAMRQCIEDTLGEHKQGLKPVKYGLSKTLISSHYPGWSDLQSVTQSLNHLELVAHQSASQFKTPFIFRESHAPMSPAQLFSFSICSGATK